MAERAFEWFLRRIDAVLEKEFDRELATAVIADTRVEYVRLRPEVPDIGGRANVFQSVMTVNHWAVALHFAMKKQGKSAADTVRACQTVTDQLFRSLPRPVLRLLGWALLTGPSRRYFQSQAERSQNREFAEDFVWQLEQQEDGEMSFLFSECAVNKWYDKLNVRELKPYCNFFDVTYSRLMNMGLDASETIGQGCDRCALRFKHDRETVVPKNLEGVIAPEPRTS